MQLWTILGSATLALVLATPARAASVLYTSPVNHRQGNSIACVIANVSAKSLNVTIDLLNESGATVAPFPVSATLAPGEVAKGFASSGIATPYAYCRFTVANGTPKQVRAGYCLAEVDDEACFATGDAR
jgi:hypothetical protein